MPPETPRVFLVEDDVDQRDGMTSLLRAGGFPVQSWPTGEAFLAAHTATMTGCLMTDVRLPGMSGVSLIRALRQKDNKLPAIVVSGFAETPLVVDAMRAGAVDFLEKPLDPLQAVAAVRNAMNGASTAASLRSEAAMTAARLASLSDRDREVFVKFSQGLTTKQIADGLGLSPKTIETYRTRLLERLAVTSPSALIRLSVLIGIFGPSGAMSRG